MFSAMLSVGTRARFWNTVSIPASRMVRAPPSAHGFPSTQISPESALDPPEMIEIRVLFPAPLSPTSPSTSPRSRDSETPRSATTGPNRLVMSETSSAGAGRPLSAAGGGPSDPAPAEDPFTAGPPAAGPPADDPPAAGPAGAGPSRTGSAGGPAADAAGLSVSSASASAVSGTGTRSSRWYSTSSAAATTSAAPTARSAT